MSSTELETAPRLQAATDPIENGLLKACRWFEFLGGTVARRDLLITFQVNYLDNPDSTLSHQAFMDSLGYELSDEDCLKGIKTYFETRHEIVASRQVIPAVGMKLEDPNNPPAFVAYYATRD